MHFPLVILKINEAPIFFLGESQCGIESKGGENFYKSGRIFDCDGVEYALKGYSRIQLAKFLTSLKYFQPMFKLDVQVEKTMEHDISFVKRLLLQQVKCYPDYWLALGNYEYIEGLVKSAEDLPALYSIFR